MRMLKAYFTADDLAPEEFVAHRVREYLAADAKMTAIFGSERVRVLSVYVPTEFDPLPCHLIALSLSADEPAPSLLRPTVTIYHVFKWSQSGTQFLADGEAGLATYWRHVNRVLSSGPAKLLQYEREDGKVVQTVARSEPGQVTTTPEGQLGDGAFVFRSVLPWVYELRLNPDGQVIRNLVNG